LKQWTDLDDKVKKDIDIQAKIKAKSIKGLAAATFAKIPMACLLRLPVSKAPTQL
jgi:hypothetical protein